MPVKQAEKSLETAKLRKPLFEPGFVYNQAYALADILNPVAKDAWDLIEVKSSSSVKDEHYRDVAFQKYAYEGAGLKIRKCYLMYINNQYVRKGDIDPRESGDESGQSESGESGDGKRGKAGTSSKVPLLGFIAL